MANIRALDDALALFAKLPTQNILSWNFALRTYARKGQGQQVLHLFNQMQQQGVMPNRVTFVCIFSSYASRASLPEGKQMHARIQGSKFEVDVVVGTALVNMYGRCFLLVSKTFVGMYLEILEKGLMGRRLFAKHHRKCFKSIYFEQVQLDAV